MQNKPSFTAFVFKLFKAEVSAPPRWFVESKRLVVTLHLNSICPPISTYIYSYFTYILHIFLCTFIYLVRTYTVPLYCNSKDEIALLAVESRHLQIWLKDEYETTLQNVTFYYWAIQLIDVFTSQALLEFHPPIWCEHKYWDSCLTGLSKWSAVSCCINSSDIKSRECVVSVISRASVFWILHSKMRELTLREKQAIWMLKEKRKSIRAVAKTKGHGEIKSLETTSDTSNQLIGWENNSSWWQTNHKSCEN